MKKLYIAIFTVVLSLVGNTVWASSPVINSSVEGTASVEGNNAAAYVVYTGNGSQSVSAEFASHYGKDASTFRGKRIGFTYQDGDSNLTNFIAWILQEGATYNHEYGLLQLDAKLLAQQAKSLPSRLTAQK